VFEGLVLLSRDNCAIVKDIYGGAIDILMKEQVVHKAVDFVKQSLQDVIDEKLPQQKLIITKSLRSYYKNPEQIAHNVLSMRIGERDPGNKPMVNDRIPYVYIQKTEKKGQKLLQGDRIEHPNFIIENKLTPDYYFYITNQIMKPVGQIYTLIAEQLLVDKKDIYESKYKYFLTKYTKEKADEKLNELKSKNVCEYIFGDILRKSKNKRENKNSKLTTAEHVHPKEKRRSLGKKALLPEILIFLSFLFLACSCFPPQQFREAEFRVAVPFSRDSFVFLLGERAQP
jgi:hypothetical protein